MHLAIIFDMDGVLLDTERLGMRAWISAAATAGLRFDEDFYRGMIGLSHRETKSYLRGLSWDESSIIRVFDHAWAIYIESLEGGEVPQKAGVSELFDFLDTRSIRRAVATSTDSAIAARQLSRAGLMSRLNAIVGGDQVKNGKPAPDIFLQAAARLGYRPADCIVVEDSQPGICAACDAGMKVIWVPDLVQVDRAIQERVFAIVESLTEARDVIAGLAGKS